MTELERDPTTSDILRVLDYLLKKGFPSDMVLVRDYIAQQLYFEKTR
jgi:hypothetical protein